MQVVASNPVSAVREDVPQDVIDHEMGIYKAQAAESGKPEAIQEKIALGKLEKFYKENVLTEQVFVKDSNETISSLAKKVSKSIGDDIKVVTFVRFNFGE
jgi:elongation factor Ts